MKGKMKTVHGIYKKHGRLEFLEAAKFYSEHVNPLSIEKTISEMESRWYDEQLQITAADKMVADYNNGLTILNNQTEDSVQAPPIMTM